MDREKFSEFDESTLAEWRTNQVSEAFLQWLAMQADRCNYECAGLLRKAEERKAMAIAGKAEAYEEILRACHRTDPPVEPADEITPDPAFRFNPGLAPIHQEETNAGTD